MGSGCALEAMMRYTNPCTFLFYALMPVFKFSLGGGVGKCPAGHVNLIDAVIAGEVFVCGLVCYGFFNVFLLCLLPL